MRFILPRSSSAKDTRLVGYWLFVCAAMVFIMTIIGSITRLTESGLSIVEWQPLMGIIPPLNDTEWQRLFILYQQTPEYIYKNTGMSLDEFKQIFWWEWLHRLWGRVIGLVFLIPLLWLWMRGFLWQALLFRLGILFVLGGLQGLLGWFMVQSGLVDRPSVSHYYLVLHLILAVVLMGAMISLALQLCDPYPSSRTTYIASYLYRFGQVILLWFGITMIWGGFVAGLDAGVVYNTFPTMHRYWLPPESLSMRPWWLNLFENTAMVQFCHRWFAITLWVLIMLFWIKTWKSDLAIGEKNIATLLAVVTTSQVLIGIMTLILAVPVWLGVLHQSSALIVFTILLWMLHKVKTPERVAS